LNVPVPKDLLLEDSLVKLLENQVAFQLLLEQRFNQEDPNLLNFKNCLSNSRIESDYEIKDPSEALWFLVKGGYCFIALSHLPPYPAPQL
jgi:hypothetical protein